MPSVIGTDSTSGINVAANYLKARPSTRFSTRQLAFFNIAVTGIETSFEAPNSLFSKVIRAVQVVAEIYAVGTPASGNVIVVVATDTTTGETKAFNANATKMSTAIGNSAVVTPIALLGNGVTTLSANITYGGTSNTTTDYAVSGDGGNQLIPYGGTGNQIPPYEDEDANL